MGEHPYRRVASPGDDARTPPAWGSRRLLSLAARTLLLVLLTAPVAMLAAQPYSFYATLVVGGAASWTAALLLVTVRGA